MSLLIRASRVVSGERGEPEQARAIAVSNGRVEALLPVDTPATARTVLELGSDVVVLPGLVDPHVHLCEPGNTEWEGFATATRAAAAGETGPTRRRGGAAHGAGRPDCCSPLTTFGTSSMSRIV